jgi:hypothetical protein
MLPIRRVVLFKHGIGFFEREVEVDGDQSLDLHFKASEMNDVLKSLTVLDLGQGHIASIGYESTAPLDKRLEDIAIRLPEGTALTGLLDQVKGARVRCQIAGESIEGLIAGIETSWQRRGEQAVQTHHLVLWVDGESLRLFDLLEIRSLTFADESLKQDLGHLLDVLISGKKKDLKKLTIFARGNGRRAVNASYVVETPVWKTSYRILLGGEQPVIQGWALVDNTQDEDWDDVSLSLVSGLPVSFVHDLYSPRYQRRPVVEVVNEQAYAPPMLQAGMAFEPGERELQARGARPVAAPAAMRHAPPPPPAAAMPRSEAMARSARVETRVEQVGDLFEYRIARPVSVGRGASALVPILHASFDGKQVAIYNREIREQNPMSAILFENTTGVTLEGGPLTVLEGNRYLGESMLSSMKVGEKRLVPFSVELGCVVGVDHKSDLRSVHHTRISNGKLWLNRYQVKRTNYVAHSKLDAPLDLFIEHRFVDGWELIDTPAPAETTDESYRFRVRLPARGKLELAVSERGAQWESFGLSNLNRDAIEVWVDNRTIDQTTLSALGGIIELNDRIASLDATARDRERDVLAIHENQARLRENLQALGTGQDERRLRERYISELSEQEDLLRNLSATLVELRGQRALTDAELKRQISTLELDAHT